MPGRSDRVPAKVVFKANSSAVQTLEEWYGPRLPTLPLSSLKDAVIGIDASYYLDQRLNKQSQEPLLSALGGFPFVLKSSIERELSILKSHGVTAIFVFNGLEFGGTHRESAVASSAAARAFDSAWTAYDSGDVSEVLKGFQRAGNSAEALYKFLQKILIQNKVDFLVAPYSASAQLASLEKQQDRFIDAIMGSTDLFLFDVDKTIVKIDFEQNTFDWLSKASCQERLDRVSDSAFKDALLLTGTQFLPAFPPLEKLVHGQKSSSIRDALNMLNGLGRSVMALCNQYRDDHDVQSLEYADRYKKALMTIKHHVVMESDGKVCPMDMEHAPGDVHEFIGARMPEELYFYVSKGILSPDVPNWITSGIADVSLPPGTADSEAYRRLMREQLLPVWTESLSLLSTSLHRYYQSRSVKVNLYYGGAGETQINLRDVPSVRDQLSLWKVHDDSLPKTIKDLHNNTVTIFAALKSLKEASFVSQTLTKPTATPISSRAEVISNSLWRFLQLRKYISPTTHELTSWGTALHAALAHLDPGDKLEEAVFLCIEMVRLGLVNGDDMFANVSGGPARGTPEQKRHANLIARVACFGRLKHKPLGYSGPLSRQMLTYASLINAVRGSLRNLLEVAMAGMFLGADVDRNRDDWLDLGISLPLINDNGCGLAIVTRTYFDEVAQHEDPPSAEQKEEAKQKATGYFQHVVSFSKNLDLAFKLWDAVYVGTKAAGAEFKDQGVWDNANDWLKARR